MNPDNLAFGAIQYVVFLFSTVCHEAAHSLVAKIGGDLTAFEGGQVSLNPIPHIRPRAFGMVVMPLIGIVSGTGLIGWASAPYNPQWSQQYPKRAAWMSLAGPATNFAIALLAGILMRIGLTLGYFAPGEVSTGGIVVGPGGGGIRNGDGFKRFLFPQHSAGLFQPAALPPARRLWRSGTLRNDSGALKLQEWRVKMGAFSIIGLLLGWRLLSAVYWPVLATGIHGIFAFYRFS